MTNASNGGPAFPVEMQDGDLVWNHEGMTLRDYFAAKSMHQLLAGAVFPVGFDAAEQLASLAELSYKTADSMLKARSKP